MRILRVIAAVTASALSLPAFAAGPGFYAGLYGAASIRTAADFDFGFVGAVLDGDDLNPTPTSYVNNGVTDVGFGLLNQGLNLFPGADLAEAFAFTGIGSLQYAPGATFGAVAGYDFGNGWRVEGDLSSTSFQVTGLAFSESLLQLIEGDLDTGSRVWTWDVVDEEPGAGMPPIDLDAELAATSAVQFFLLDAWYDIDIGGPVTPYVGGGLGFAHVATLWTSNGDELISGGATTPAAAIGAGLRLDVADRLTLDLGYRYKAAFNATVESSAVEPLGPPAFFGLGTLEHGTIGVHAVQAGLTVALQ